MAGLFEEVKRRNVARVSVAYMIVASLILQVVTTVFRPCCTVTFVTVFMVLGLPVALIFAWVYEVTQGISGLPIYWPKRGAPARSRASSIV